MGSRHFQSELNTAHCTVNTFVFTVHCPKNFKSLEKIWICELHLFCQWRLFLWLWLHLVSELNVINVTQCRSQNVVILPTLSPLMMEMENLKLGPMVLQQQIVH